MGKTCVGPYHGTRVWFLVEISPAHFTSSQIENKTHLSASHIDGRTDGRTDKETALVLLHGHVTLIASLNLLLIRATRYMLHSTTKYTQDVRLHDITGAGRYGREGVQHGRGGSHAFFAWHPSKFLWEKTTCEIIVARASSERL